MLGRFLFRWRGAIGALSFGLVFWLAKPTFGSCLLGVPLLILGLAVRFWASGYIGIAGRVKEIGGQSEERGARMEEEGSPRRRIVTGPYRILRHPLYIGNSLLVTGMLVALKPVVWLAGVVMVGFVVEYGLIVVSEEKQLASLEFGRSQKTEVRRQSEARPAAGEGQKASDEGFWLSRATCEWRTWVVTGVGWGLAMMKALLVRS